MRARRAVIGLAPAIAEEPRALLRRRKGTGAQPLRVAAHPSARSAQFGVFHSPQAVPGGGWRPSESSHGITAQTSSFSSQTLCLPGKQRSPGVGFTLRRLLELAPYAFSVTRWLQERDRGGKECISHYELQPLCSGSLGREIFPSLPRPSAPCSSLIIFG